jgi:hypothetical protein
LSNSPPTASSAELTATINSVAPCTAARCTSGGFQVSAQTSTLAVHLSSRAIRVDARPGGEVLAVLELAVRRKVHLAMHEHQPAVAHRHDGVVELRGPVLPRWRRTPCTCRRSPARCRQRRGDRRRLQAGPLRCRHHDRSATAPETAAPRRRRARGVDRRRDACAGSRRVAGIDSICATRRSGVDGTPGDR